MNYNNDNFNYSSLIFNKKYRSRLILAIYTILFFILIIFLRTSINNKNYNESNNEVFINENEDNKNEESENSYIKSLFSYIDMNNYNFEFKISYNNNVYISSGKRSDRKYDFTLTDGNNIVHYLVSGKLVKIKQENSYENSILPYFYINHFDNEVLKSILSKSKQISESTYEITNGILSSFVDSNYNLIVGDDELINTIELDIKNNIIVGINMDFTNLFNDYDEVSLLKISLNYFDFGLVDDFNVNFN